MTVDLLECLTCRLRFTVVDTGVGDWACPECDGPLALVAIGLHGTPEQLSTALHAHHLLSLSHRPDGLRGTPARVAPDQQTEEKSRR